MTSTETNTKNAAQSYHHGDLRNALIVAAAQLIEESGSEDFAMTDAARRAGVSSGAPYRHFKDKDDLLLAVGDLGFFDLSLQLRAVGEIMDTGTIERIIELGKCYIRFVTGRPAFFDIMWGERRVTLPDTQGTEDPELRVSVFSMLVAEVQAWCQRENLPDSDPQDIALKLWSMGIGLSHLAINNHLERFVEGVDPYELLSSSTYAFLGGVKGAYRAE